MGAAPRAARALRRVAAISRALTSAAAAPAGGGGEARAHVAVVVGAGAATGAALCRALAEEHGYVVYAARRRFPSEEDGAGGDDGLGAHPRILRRPCDARDAAQVERLFAEARAAGELRFVAHNIGGNVRFGALQTTERVFRKVWELCALSTFLVGKEAAAAMAAHGGGGTIAFTGATASTRGAAGFGAFASAMHAKRGFAQALAKEVGPLGIHVCHLVVDAPIDTAFVRENFLPRDATLARRMLPPEDVASAILAMHKQPARAWAFEMDLRSQHEPW